MKILNFIVLTFISLVLNSCITTKYYTNFVVPESVTVNNFTDYAGSDTMIMVILSDILNYDTIGVNIYPLYGGFNYEDFVISAQITKNPFEEDKYSIYLADGLEEDILEDIITHELIHLQQMESGDLTILTNQYVWMGDTVDFTDVVYNNRLFEIDAFNNQDYVRFELDSLINEKYR